MAAYCGSIGSVNVLEIVSTDLFDESQENPFLLQQQCGLSYSGNASPVSKMKLAASTPPRSPTVKHQSVRFADLPLADQNDSRASMASPVKTTKWSPQSSPAKRQSTVQPVVVPTPTSFYQQPPPPPPPMPASPHATVSFSPPGSPIGQRPSITIQLPYSLLQRQGSSESNASTMASQADHDAFLTAEEAELHKLLYSLSRLGFAQPPPMQAPPAGQPSVLQYQQQSMNDHAPQVSFQTSYASTASAPTSPTAFSSSSLWLPSQSQHAQLAQPQPTMDNAAVHPPNGTASLMFRALPSRQSSRRASNRQSKVKRFSSAPNSPQHQSGGGFFSDGEDDEESPPQGRADYNYGSQPSSPQAHNSRGSVTFLTVKNLLRGGGALARTVRHEQPNRRPTCYGTVSSRLKRRQKFERPTVITDAFHRVSDMKLGTSPMKVKIKHVAFPQTWATDEDHQADVDPGISSPKGQLRRESLITLETLDKIGTRHACPVQLIEEPLPDFSNIQPRVDAWNHYKKPKSILRRPSAWLLGATATSTPHGLNH